MRLVNRASIDGVRNSEHTGDNRCTPCTVTNLIFAIIGSGVLLIISPVASLVTFSTSVLMIYFRGYLVPGTPTLTQQYFPDRVLAKFDKSSGGNGDPNTFVNLNTYLNQKPITTNCGSDICLTQEFKNSWASQMELLKDKENYNEELSSLLGVSASELSMKKNIVNYEIGVDYRGKAVGRWASKASFIIDLATAREFMKRFDDWDRLSSENRGEIMAGFRVFAVLCPLCDSPLEVKQESLESCCRSYNTLVSSCENCGAEILEQEVSNQVTV